MRRGRCGVTRPDERPAARPPAPRVPAAGEHGDDARRVAAALGIHPGALLDLATTLNPVAPDVAPLVARAAASVRWYPDPAPATASLAAHLGVDPDLVVLTNGGAEAIALVASAFPHGRVDGPEFSLYERHLESTGSEATAVRWASNPNNPTGRLAGADERAGVWDEAHYPLATGSWSRGDAGALRLGSFTKLLACPGLRLGWVVAPDAAVAARLRARQPAWSVGSIACEVVPDLLDLVDLPRWTREVAVLRGALAAILRRHGFEPPPSDAPWLLVPGSAGLRDRLVVHGVLVRDGASFGLPDHTRIGIPDAIGLERLDAALTAALGAGAPVAPAARSGPPPDQGPPTMPVRTS